MLCISGETKRANFVVHFFPALFVVELAELLFNSAALLTRILTLPLHLYVQHTHCTTQFQVLKAHVRQVLFVSLQLGVVVISQSLQLLTTTYMQHNMIDALPLRFKMEREGGGI